jgi:hypothetical protein
MISREFNQKYLGPGAMIFMIVGILCLCQPWVGVLHAWSVLIMIIGLIGFNIAAHLPAPEAKAAPEQSHG